MFYFQILRIVKRNHSKYIESGKKGISHCWRGVYKKTGLEGPFEELAWDPEFQPPP